jgi:hypothetical protein
MARYRVEALEKFTVRTVYHDVEAPNAAAAELRCFEGKEAYDESANEEGGEEWLETISVEEITSEET